MFKKEIYRKTIFGYGETVDGGTPTIISITQENNGFLCWFKSYEDEQILFHEWTQNMALEKGVLLAETLYNEIYTLPPEKRPNEFTFAFNGKQYVVILALPNTKK